MILHITHAKALPCHRLHVLFSNGQEVLTDNKVSSCIRCNLLIDGSRRQPRSGNVSS